jgi:3',5'-nucleoside bisphosphate phosphatase
MTARDPERFDLHTHSHRSDGVDRPAQLVAWAAEAGLAGLALTDHDTGDGVPEAQEAADERGLELVPGTEFSAEYETSSVHVLGLWVDHAEPALAAELARLRTSRTDRAREIVTRFVELGIPVSFERVVTLAGGAPIGRPHIARAVVETGAVTEEREVFDRFLADGGPAHVPKYAVDPVRAVELLTGAGGVAVLAHPALFGPRDGRHELPIGLVEAMAGAGLVGIEADHPEQHGAASARWREVARRLDLVITAGSDHHGGQRGDRIGAATTGRTALERLRSSRR